MKVYISSDIEGTAGIVNWDETDMEKGGRWYDYFREQMSKESAAAARGAFAAGASAVTVKDAHDSARNLIPSLFPEDTQFVRGWPGSPYSMVDTIDEGYDAVGFTGYHSAALEAGNPLSHTMTTIAHRVLINGAAASEFQLHAMAAALHGAKAVFLSGDEALCRAAEAFAPGIVTAAVFRGVGGGAVSLHPAKAVKLIEEGMEKAVSKIDSIPLIKLPEHYEAVVEYVRHPKAYRVLSYPGAEAVSSNAVRFESDSLGEVLAFLHFAL